MDQHAKGVLSLERCQKVTGKYEQEQQELADEAATLDKFVQREQESSDNFNRLVRCVIPNALSLSYFPRSITEWRRNLLSWA